MTSPTLAELIDLGGHTAVVTGGAVGIGRGIALRLAEAGAGVLVVDRDAGAAADTAGAIVDAGGKAAPYGADVSSVADATAAMTAAEQTLGGLDILVNNAGIFPMRPFLDLDEGLWDHVLAVNLKGAFFWAQAAARHMISRSRTGSIVNIASIDALHPTGNLVHYDASKGGLVMMTRSLALELGAHGIRVNAIAPGAIDTPGARAVSTPVPGSPPPDMSGFLRRIPMGRQGTPDDIARAVLFCASDLSAYMTGALVVVDGGFLLS